jgi:hypothetical protein
MRVLSLVLALGMVTPQKARARPRNSIEPSERSPARQGRRGPQRTGLLALPPSRSPSGRHLVEVDAGAVYLDGRRVHPASGTVQVLAPPAWRSDGEAVAWLERGAGETRLVVVPEVSAFAPPLAWPLPRALGGEGLHWAAPNRLIVGPAVLAPRAVASWTE